MQLSNRETIIGVRDSIRRIVGEAPPLDGEALRILRETIVAFEPPVDECLNPLVSADRKVRRSLFDLDIFRVWRTA